MAKDQCKNNGFNGAGNFGETGSVTQNRVKDDSAIWEDPENIAKELVNKKLTTSQLRKFLSAVNKLENKANAKTTLTEAEIKEIHFLNVKLAYQAGREKEETALKCFYYLLKDKIKQIKDKDSFLNFARYIESIVAYHKFYGGE